MKKLTIPCKFGRVNVPFPLFIGEPLPECHPLKYQAAWLAEERSGTVSPEVMDSFAKLQLLAEEHGESFEKTVIQALEQRPPQQAPESDPESSAPPAPP